MSKHSVLILSYYANMPGACQAEWVDDRMFAFIEKGYDISLVSATCCFTHANKHIRHIKTPALSPGGARYEYEEIHKRHIPVTKGPVYWYTWLMVFFDKLLSKVGFRSGEGRWSWFLSSAIACLCKIDVRNQAFIFTTGGPASAHLTGILLGKLYGKRVICEFQDPLSGTDIGRNRLSQIGLRFFEKRIIKYADCTIYCTENAMLDARKKYAAYSHKIFFVYPGSNAVEHYQQSVVETVTDKKHAGVNITYLGSLYQTRNLDAVMRALNEMAVANNQQPPPITIHIYGNMNADIRERILQFPYKGILLIHGLISREQAMQKALEADVLLLIQNIDERSVATIPFKTYDYLHTGKLILALVYKNNEIERIMLEHGHLVCQADDIAAIKAHLYSIADNLSDRKVGIRKSNLTPDGAVTKMLELVAQIPYRA